MWNNPGLRNSCIAICFIVLVASCGTGRASRGSTSNEMTEQTEFTTLARGQYSGIEEKKYVIVTSQEEWEILWEKVHKFITPAPDLPVTDFASDIVLGVFMGTRPTGGYSIEIDELRACDDRIRAIVKSRSPEPEDMVTTALTQPYHIIRFEATEWEIEFKEK
jgi:hypothetical protein